MIEKIKNTIKKYNMLSSESYLAVALSGGADSVALLDILQCGGYRVCAIHINHMIRGEEADRDEDFCRELCKKRSVPFFCHRIDVPGEAKARGESLELTARRLRYEAIEKTVALEGIDRVATAHHGDDNAETVIFNIVRGSGTKGGCGIPAVRGIYVRPLIECTRDEIIGYCAQKGLDFVTDSTNLSTDYTRNFIRHEIMPKLKEINPNSVRAFTVFSNSLRRDEEFISSLVPKKATRSELARLPDPVLVRYIKQYCESGSRQIDALISAIRKGNEYVVTDMGEKIFAVCDRNNLTFRKKITPPTHNEFIITDECTHIPQFGDIYMTRDKARAEELVNIYKIAIYSYLKFDKIKGDIFLRSRREGDRYRYKGMTHSLKKLFCARHIPVEQRSRVPLFCDEDGIVWIPEFLPTDRVRADKNEENIIFIGYVKGVTNDIE